MTPLSIEFPPDSGNPQHAKKRCFYALLQPAEKMKELQDKAEFTELMMLSEELKTLPFGDIWEHYCDTLYVPATKVWFEEVRQYEMDVLSRRG